MCSRKSLSLFLCCSVSESRDTYVSRNLFSPSLRDVSPSSCCQGTAKEREMEDQMVRDIRSQGVAPQTVHKTSKQKGIKRGIQEERKGAKN